MKNLASVTVTKETQPATKKQVLPFILCLAVPFAIGVTLGYFLDLPTPLVVAIGAVAGGISNSVFLAVLKRISKRGELK